MDPRLVGRQPHQAHNALDDQQMQSAKFTLLSSLLKPEPKATKLIPGVINEFHPLLVAVANQHVPNSPEFVKCVAKMVTYIAPSRKRLSAVGNHLVKLALSCSPASDPSSRDSAAMSFHQAHAALNFLHLLGAIYACIRSASTLDHSERTKPAVILSSGVAGHAIKLIEIAAQHRGLEAVAVHKQIHSLLLRWREAHTFTKALRVKLGEAARAGYDSWLTWLKTTHPREYEKISNLSLGSHSHLLVSKDTSDESWYNALCSSIVPHINGQNIIQTSAFDVSTTLSAPLDPELDAVIKQHISDMAKIHAGPNVSRFSSDDDAKLNGLGQPISIDADSGKRKRIGPVYYGVSENCARSFKKARDELPVFVHVQAAPSQAAMASRNVPPPSDIGSRGFSGSYPSAPLSTGSINGGRGGGGSWGGDRGRGFGGRGGGPGRGRGRGGWGGWD